MKIVTVKMTEDQNGCPDGIKVRPYEKDGVYDLPEDLANCFLNDLECAELVAPEDLKTGEDDVVTPEKPSFFETPESEGEKLETPEK